MTRSWTLSDKTFYSLLGIPKEYGIAYMLTDHFVQIGKLNIESIAMRAPGSANYDFIGFTLVLLLGNRFFRGFETSYLR